MIIKNSDAENEKNASEAIGAARRLRRLLSAEAELANAITIGAVSDSAAADVRFFVSRSETSTSIETVDYVLYDDNPLKFVWERGCLIRCELPIRLPFYYSVNKPSGELL